MLFSLTPANSLVAVSTNFDSPAVVARYYRQRMVRVLEFLASKRERFGMFRETFLLARKHERGRRERRRNNTRRGKRRSPTFSFSESVPEERELCRVGLSFIVIFTTIQLWYLFFKFFFFSRFYRFPLPCLSRQDDISGVLRVSRTVARDIDEEHPHCNRKVVLSARTSLTYHCTLAASTSPRSVRCLTYMSLLYTSSPASNRR